jgi:hypothetical protein
MFNSFTSFANVILACVPALALGFAAVSDLARWT